MLELGLKTKWQIREHEIFSEILTDKLEIIIIELPKVEQAYLKDKDNELLQWMMFLLNLKSLEVSKIMENNQNIKVASEQLEQISEDEINQRIAELREKARRDDVANRLTGERIGREKAEKKFEERLREQIHKMIDFCLSINQIAEITGLSVEEIEKLSNN